eukprot:Nk52_evm52s359 gene=Nk52_evmTU52s359
MSGKFQQLRLLLWKNYILRKRRLGGTIVELIIPAFFFGILCIIRAISSRDLVAEQNYPPISPLYPLDNQLSTKYNGYASYCFAYYPPGAAGFMSGWQTFVEDFQEGEALQFGIGYRKYNYTSMEQLENSITEYSQTWKPVQSDCSTPTAAIYFPNLKEPTSSVDFTQNVSYMLRMPYGNTPKVKDTTQQTGSLSAGPNTNYDYLDKGFVYYQLLIESYISWEMCRNTDDNPTVNCAQSRFISDSMNGTTLLNVYPYPEYWDDDYVNAISNSLGLFFMLAWLYSVAITVKAVCEEKEKRLKETMKIMGLKNWINVLSWWISGFIFFFLTIIIATILTKYGSIVEYTSISVMFVYYVLFGLATLSFAFMISSWFTNAKIGAVAAAVLYFLSYVPFTFVDNNWDDTSTGTKSVYCILSTTCFCQGAKVIALFEKQGKGVDWNNIKDGPTPDDDFSLQMVFNGMFIDIFLYFIIAWYCEAVFPGQYGIPEKWYFFLTPSYWGCTRKGRGSFKETVDPVKGPTNEEEPKGLHAGIMLKDLQKTYSNGKKALKGLSVNMYKGQITSLLGHNGAGKTTTMSILTGLYTPTSGDAWINGQSIQGDMQSIRKNLGICPQHNVLWDVLTVEEHLEFYCILKGVPKAHLKEDISEMVEDLQLTDKRDAHSSQLSGGMQRKLSVAIALVGGSEIVILDEPTAGMDPYARRATWDLLLKHKEGRTMLLSTHFMDEADLLGDRIAIVANGELVCSGTSMFLKSKYGVGYHMTMVKNEDCESTRVHTLLLKHIPDCDLVSDVGAELTFILPSSNSKKFAGLFQELEETSADLGIQSYGISVTTLEEVFLKVGDGDLMTLEDKKMSSKLLNRKDMADALVALDAEDNETNKNEEISGKSINETSENHLIDMKENDFSLDKDEYLSGTALKKQQFRAMFQKRWIHSKRDTWAAIPQLVFPALFVLLALLVGKSSDVKTTSDQLPLSTAIYGKLLATPVFAQRVSSVATTSENYMNVATSTLDSQTMNNEVSEMYYQTASFPIYQEKVNKVLLNASDEDEGKYSYQTVGLFYNNTDCGNNVDVACTKSVGWFNNDAIHAVAIAMNLANNAFLGALCKQFGLDTLSIVAYNWPLPMDNEEKQKEIILNGGYATVAIFVVFGMSFLAASFVNFIVAERESKAKHIQFVSGVDPFSFWLGTFTWDLLNYLIPTIVIFILFAVFDEEEYTGENFPAVILLFITFGWAMIPLMYICSFMFTVPANGFVAMVGLNILLGLATIITTNVLDYLGTGDPSTSTVNEVNDALKQVFLIFPVFSLGRGIMDLGTNYANGLVGSAEEKDALDWTLTGRNIFAMIMEGIGFFGIVVLIEYRFFIKKKPIKASFEGDELDSDVAEEAKRVKGGGAENDIVVVKDLAKVYKGAGKNGVDKVAVRNLNLGIPNGECFGLLGVNGAGKTTTFKMLTGDEIIDGGEAFMDGFSVINDMPEVRKRIGYCPQFDAIIDKMTSKELLTMYALMRGIPRDKVPLIVDKVVEALGLKHWAHRQCGGYSGGNKRKLSTAVAIVGDPSIVFLDEPTTGMDPKARRFLWNVITGIMKEGRSIVLTSHSMEECEALCTRLAIMVNGQFKCLGSPQHLKNKFGSGYHLIIKLKSEEKVATLKSHIESKFPSALLKEEHSVLIHYEFTDNTLKLSDMFSAIESIKEEYMIEDYSFSQTLLEQIFIKFAKDQEYV